MTKSFGQNKIEKIIPIIFWAFALLYFAYESFQKPVYSTDDFFQTLVAQNVTHGNGFSLLEVNLSDLSEPKFKKYFNFAPGYTLILSVLTQLFQDPAIIHHLIIFIFSLASLVVLYKLFYKLIPKPNYLIVYLTLLFVVVSNLFQGGPSDLITINLFLISLFVFSKIIEEKEAFSIKKLLILSVLCFLLGFFRYAYYPICFVYVLCFFVLFIIQKDMRWVKMALVNGLLVLLLLLPQLIGKIYMTEQVSIVKENNLEMAEKSLNFIHLLYIKPVFLSVFIDDVIIYRLLGYEGIGGYDRGFMVPMSLRLLILGVSILIMLLLTFFGIKAIYNAYKKNDARVYSILMGLGIGAFVKIAFFVAIAVYYESYGKGHIWTLAMVGRYYNLVFVAIAVFSFLYLSSLRKPISWINKLIVVTLVGFLCMNFAHKSYLSTNFSFTDRNKNINIYYPPQNLIIDSKLLMKKIKNDPNKYAAFLYKGNDLNSAEKAMMSYITLAGIPFKNINKEVQIKSSKEVEILSTLNETELNNITSMKVINNGIYQSMANNQTIVYSYSLTNDLLN